MPPLQAASCVTDRPVCPVLHPRQPTTSESGKLDGTDDIVNHVHKMNITEERSVMNISGEESREGAATDIKPSVKDEDLVAIISAVKSISLTSKTTDLSVKDAENGNACIAEDTEKSETSIVKGVERSQTLKVEGGSDDEDDDDDDDDDDVDSGDDKVRCSKQAEGSGYDDSSSSDDDEEEEDEGRVRNRINLISRGPDRNKTHVYSRDRQTGGCVYTYPHISMLNTSLNLHTSDNSLPLPTQQWWSDYDNSKEYVGYSNVDSSPSSDLLQPDLDPVFLFPEATNNFNMLPADIVDEYFQQLENDATNASVGSSEAKKPAPDRETDDEGIAELFPSSPESSGQNSQNSSPAHSYANSISSGLASPMVDTMSLVSSSQSPSPARVYVPSMTPPHHVPSMTPPHHVPIRPKARPAREAILEQISQDEKDEAWLKINAASEEKLMRVNDPDGDTNLTVLMRFWEKHNRPMALLYAMVERMKFIKNGLSKKTLKGENALRLASAFAHADPLVAKYIAEVMVECGADVNEVDVDGNTVIHCLCWKGDSHVHVLEELLSIKVFDVNLANNHKETPLGIACIKGAVQTVALLLASGAQLDPPKNGASSQGEPLTLLPPEKLQEVERLYKQWARRRFDH